MAEELSLDSIKDMKKADFIKAFKTRQPGKKLKQLFFWLTTNWKAKKR
jgi:hypothetical protein